MSKENRNELTQKQMENKKEDKKAFKKFAVIMIVAFAAGILVGFGSSVLENVIQEGSVQSAIQDAAEKIAVYGGYIVTTGLLIAGVVLYKKSHTEYSSWDEEDEEVLSGIETKLSYVIWFSHLIMFGSYFFFSAGVWAVDILEIKCAIAENNTSYWVALGAVFGNLIYSLAVCCIMQQKAINLSKEINPEKRGSIYEMKFQDKWMESCDEAERYAAYKCSFKTFKTMQLVGMLLWLVCLVGQMSFNTGAFATIVVTIFMIIQTSVYSVQSIYFAKHPSEVMK